MRKSEFLYELRRALSGLPQSDVEERISFYSEMIDDRMEEGLSEEEVVAGIGSPHDVAEQIKADFVPTDKEANKEKQKHKWHWGPIEILLVILAAPFILSVGSGILGTATSVYASVWATVISLWACVIALWGVALGGVIYGFGMILTGSLIPGLAAIALAIFSAGFSIFMFFAAHLAGKWTVILTKKFFVWLIGKFKGKEEE